MVKLNPAGRQFPYRFLELSSALVNCVSLWRLVSIINLILWLPWGGSSECTGGMWWTSDCACLQVTQKHGLEKVGEAESLGEHGAGLRGTGERRRGEAVCASQDPLARMWPHIFTYLQSSGSPLFARSSLRTRSSSSTCPRILSSLGTVMDLLLVLGRVSCLG